MRLKSESETESQGATDYKEWTINTHGLILSGIKPMTGLEPNTAVKLSISWVRAEKKETYDTLCKSIAWHIVQFTGERFERKIIQLANYAMVK